MKLFDKNEKGETYHNADGAAFFSNQGLSVFLNPGV